jgi:phosphate transport system substrate-binding protein
MIRTVLTISTLLFMLGCRKSGNKQENEITTIQMKGSDTMVNVAQAWAEEYKNVEPSVEIEVSGGGSGVGISALSKGTIQIATASRNMKQHEIQLVKQNTGKDPVEFVLGFDALAIFVHKDNPINQISLDQLAQIYAENGSITRWSQLGITIPGQKNDKIVRISRQSSSGTYDFFREAVLHKQDFKLGSLDMNGSKEVVELVGRTKTAIGYSGMGYASKEVKMLNISVGENKPPIAPTIENAQNRSYPLARSLLIYTLGHPEGAVKKYIDWMMSIAGQQILITSGYVPLLLSTTHQ